MRYLVLKSGFDDVDKYLSGEEVKKILKAALPNRTEYIDRHGFGGYYDLLAEIENCLLSELRKILEGRDATQAATDQAREILEAVNRLDEKKAENAVAEVQEL